MKKLFFAIFLFGIFLAKQASASDFLLSAAPAEINDRDDFVIVLYVDAETTTVNAVAGQINVPADYFAVKEIIDGDSAINFWVEKPFVNGQNQIQFSGIVPNGFTGRIKILSAILTARKIGETKISVSEPQALLNDGAGTPDNVTVRDLNLSIKPKKPEQAPLVVSLEDREPPDAFTPEILKIPSIFGADFALVFAAEDKLSGIGQYQILEKRTYNFFGLKFETGKWQEAMSPYRLRDQKLKSDIYVKAIDKMGNERTAFLPATNPINWYENYLFWGIIIAAVLVVALFVLYAKKQKQKIS